MLKEFNHLCKNFHYVIKLDFLFLNMDLFILILMQVTSYCRFTLTDFSLPFFIAYNANKNTIYLFSFLNTYLQIRPFENWRSTSNLLILFLDIWCSSLCNPWSHVTGRYMAKVSQI